MLAAFNRLRSASVLPESVTHASSVPEVVYGFGTPHLLNATSI